MDILEIYDNYSEIGIHTRHITDGEEYNMVKRFIDYRKSIFKPLYSRKLAIFLETKIGDAYPDILFVEFDPNAYENWTMDRNCLIDKDLKLLFYFYKKQSATLEQVEQDLSMQRTHILRSFEILTKANVLEGKNGYWYVPNRRSIFGVKKIEAVEAKVGNWNSVIQQAIINRTFASESFVLMKRKKAPRTEVIQKVNESGLGVYLYNSNNFSCVTKAKQNHFPINYHSVFLNEYIGRIISA